MESSGKNLQTFETWYNAHRAHDLDAMIGCLSEDVSIRSAAGGKMPPANGTKEAREHWGAIFDTFPDMRLEKIDLTVEGDTIFAEMSHGGTMKGKMLDQKPTGKSYRVPGAFRIDFRGGKIRSI